MSQPSSSRYCSYLLRCWQEAGSTQWAGAAWRFSLEDPRTGERHGFASFAALIAFLQERLLGEPTGSSAAPDEEKGGQVTPIESPV